jgi:hypothetical protein
MRLGFMASLHCCFAPWAKLVPQSAAFCTISGHSTNPYKSRPLIAGLRRGFPYSPKEGLNGRAGKVGVRALMFSPGFSHGVYVRRPHCGCRAPMHSPCRNRGILTPRGGRWHKSSVRNLRRARKWSACFTLDARQPSRSCGRLSYDSKRQPKNGQSTDNSSCRPHSRWRLLGVRG